tara:strand:+ start:703 stop:906 length:204 start_codon:yes stop_codon:yes gene_type:complete
LYRISIFASGDDDEDDEESPTEVAVSEPLPEPPLAKFELEEAAKPLREVHQVTLVYVHGVLSRLIER